MLYNKIIKRVEMTSGYFYFFVGDSMDKQTVDKLKYLINKHKTVPEIMAKLDLEEYEVYGLVHILNKEGCSYNIVDDEIVKIKCRETSYDDEYTHVEIPNKKQICFASDFHYNSILDRPDIVKAMYAECRRRDISTIVFCGDFLDGYYPRRKEGNKVVKNKDAKSQIEYAVNIHPYDPNIKMYMITGNHDYTHYENEGVIVGEEINKYRPDIVYLGHNEADLQIDKLKIKMYHGKSQNHTLLSSNAEKYLSNLREQDKPDILQLGHIHQSFYMHDGKTNVLQTGSILDQSPYLTSRRIQSERACWFAHIEYDNRGNVISIIPELYDWDKVLERKKENKRTRK